ncbi:MAG: molybdopterin-synthase adenylyltransferase MoeB [Proteobacteria bacterium]|nr:molybdopterin-synthase adenylyltransferase MoeB [Pseudomonadota bacterium]
MATFDTLLRDIKSRTSEIAAATLHAELSGGARVVLLDVREADEHAQGALPDTTWIPRGFLELRIEGKVPDRATPIVIYCAGGTRSALAARSLVELGYTAVRSLAGGFTAWKTAGLPWDQPRTLRPDQIERYARHLLLPEVGNAGQLKLLAAKVLCIGAGGLGSPSSMYLAAAGIGTLGIVDDDVVDASNLQRQILHGTDRVGLAKVDSAETTLRGLNPDVVIHKHRTRSDPKNALALIGAYDVIIDGADNFATRYLVNDAALRLGKPVIHASIFRFEGQITVFPAAGGPCYRCLYPQPPPPEEAPSCAEAGVLGVLPGILGVMQATEAIKIILGLGETLAGRLVVYDALKTRFRELKLRRDPGCPTCGESVDRAAIELIDYVQFCAGPKRS